MNDKENTKTCWIIVNGKPEKVTYERWLQWRYKEENKYTDLD